MTEEKASKNKTPKGWTPTRKRRTLEEMAPIKAIMEETGFTLTTINNCIAGRSRPATLGVFNEACERLGINPDTLK
jgi:hypothetical protein